MWNSITGWKEPLVILLNCLQAREIVYFGPVDEPSVIINILRDIFKIMHLRSVLIYSQIKDFVSSP